MGYHDASLELARAHMSLSQWYSAHGGEELALKMKNMAVESSDKVNT